jgi:hypothetical protein
MRFPNFPWQKNEEETTDQEEQEGFDEQPEGDSTTEDEQFANLDDDARGLMDRAAEIAVGQQAEAVRAALQAQGLDLAADGTVVIRDPKRLTEFTAPLAGSTTRDTPVAAARTEAPSTQATGDGDERPDPHYDLEAYLRWSERQNEQKIAAAVQKVQEQQQSVAQQVYSREAGFAVEQAKALLPQYGLASLAEHPDFEEKFRGALREVDPRFWSDSTNLVRIGASLITELPAQQQNAPRDTTGRFVSPMAAVKAAVHRGALAQTGPVSDGGRTGRGEPVTDQERLDAQRIGCSIEELRSLSDETGASYRQARDKAKAGRR